MLTAVHAAHDDDLTKVLEANDSDVFYHVPPASEGEIYSDQLFAGPFDQAVGLTYDIFNRMWVWEKEGKVWFVSANGTVAPQPMIDLSEEVGNWGAHGMLGFAFDPDYFSNGYIYLYYVVDRYHLFNFDDPSYDPQVSEDFADTIARVVRYEMDPFAPAMQVQADPLSRHVLVGENETTGFPVCSTTHGVGSLVFGEDGNLLASFGDSYLKDTGSGDCFNDGIITEAENVENYRAQLRNSLAGKIIRIDPATGDGVVDNPFFDPLEPRAARSRIWTMGLRQPYRMTLRPGTGTGKHPGSIYLGDVGAQTWEEVNVVTSGGVNLGWPLYEGMLKNDFYFNQEEANRDAPNPLFGQNIPGVGVCNQEFFDFQDLIGQESIGPIDVPNLCDPNQQVPLEFQTEHIRPVLCWKHDEPVALTKNFVGGLPDYDQLGDPGATVIGESFPGNAAIGGVWYTGSDFPAAYQNVYFVGDYGEGWIKALRFDGQDRLEEVIDFSNDAGNPVAFASHPQEGGLFYINYLVAGGSVIRRVKFVGDLPPIAVASANVKFGDAPLGVQFSGSASSDPEGAPLTYEWDFGDGSTRSSAADPLHVFNAPARTPTAFYVTLTVTDIEGATDTQELTISVNNTPPVAQIIAPLNEAIYSSSQVALLPLSGSATDAESPSGEIECQWDVLLYHDNHSHPEPTTLSCLSATGVAPHTLDGDIEFYEVRFTATDPHGLAGTESHWLVRDDDCNLNGYTDSVDIAQGWSLDVDLNGIPDECSLDCDGDGMSDPVAVRVGEAPDCNGNGTPDACDIAGGASLDLDTNGVPDECQQMSTDIASVSMSTGGAQNIALHAGAEYAGDFYWIFGSLTGNSPGTPFGPVTLPLTTPDVYFDLTLAAPGEAPFINWFGFLDSSAEASAQIAFAPGSPPGYAGLTLYHAAILVDSALLGFDGIALATNSVSLELVP